jgi:hypothetical protein
MAKTVQEENTYGARVFKLTNTRFLIKQNKRRGPNNSYVIDGHRERHVSSDNDAEIASAIRDALEGELDAGRR